MAGGAISKAPHAPSPPARAIAIDSDGVKGVRVGMNGLTPPTTRIVVDLDKACQYELEPGTDGKLILKLHTGAVAAKNTAKPTAKNVVVASAPKVASPVAAVLPRDLRAFRP